MRKVLFKYAVHLGEVGHVVEEDVALDHPLDADTSLCQYADNVLAALLRLVCDAAFDQVALVVCGDLAGDEDLRACDDGLGLRVLVSVRETAAVSPWSRVVELCGW